MPHPHPPSRTAASTGRRGSRRTTPAPARRGGPGRGPPPRGRRTGRGPGARSERAVRRHRAPARSSCRRRTPTWTAGSTCPPPRGRGPTHRRRSPVPREPSRPAGTTRWPPVAPDPQLPAGTGWSRAGSPQATSQSAWAMRRPTPTSRASPIPSRWGHPRQAHPGRTRRPGPRPRSRPRSRPPHAPSSWRPPEGQSASHPLTATTRSLDSASGSGPTTLAITTSPSPEICSGPSPVEGS